MKVLVTGGHGQLGHALSEVLKDEVTLFTDSDDMDITDLEAIEKTFIKFKPEWLFHCAAYTNVDGCEENKDICTLVNDRGTENLAISCQKHGVKMIYISTDYVFDGTATSPIKPDATPNPISVYGATKLAGEKHTLAVGGYVLRTSWVYGDGKNFVKTMIDLSEKYPELTVVSDQVGRPTYALDLARAMYDISLSTLRHCEELATRQSPSSTPIPPGIYHVTGDGPIISWADFAKKIFEIAGKNSNVKYVTTEEYYAGKDTSKIANRPAYSALDLTKAKEGGIYIADWEESLNLYLN